MDNNEFWFKLIKEYYNLGLYTANDLDIFVQAKWITAEQKAEIVGNTNNTATTSTVNTDSSSNNATGATATTQ